VIGLRVANGTPTSQLMMNLVIPLFIYTWGATSRSRDTFRVVHSAIVTQVVNRNLRKFGIDISIQYLYAFSLSILFSIW